MLIIGKNGVGKSNLLEAVELLGSLRSHRARNDKDLINWKSERALLKATTHDEDKLELELRREGGRRARRNDKSLLRQLDFIGPLRCVGFSALDLQLVRGEPALRRPHLRRQAVRHARLLRHERGVGPRGRRRPARRRGAAGKG